MSSRRVAKVARAIKEVVSTTVLFELKDPRIRNVTILDVEVSSDFRRAKVSFSVLGDERMQRLCLNGLRSARGFLQAKIADRLQIRYTPILTFALDAGVKRSIEAARLLEQIRAEFLSEDKAGVGESDAGTAETENEVASSDDEAS